MKRLVAKYRPKSAGVLGVLDVGSRLSSVGLQKTYRDLFEEGEYLGIDIMDGTNVDKVVSGNWRLGRYFGLVISGQCLEHVAAPWVWIQNIRRICSGICIIIAPADWPIHKHPIDCWRILPDGMRALLRYGGFKVLETGMSHYKKRHVDCWGVGRV
jgi:hypothetical protein